MDLETAARLLRTRLWRLRRRLHAEDVPVFFVTRDGKEVPSVAVADLRRVMGSFVAPRATSGDVPSGNGGPGDHGEVGGRIARRGIERAESGLLLALDQLGSLHDELARSRNRLRDLEGRRADPHVRTDAARAIRRVRARLARAQRLRAAAEDRREDARSRMRALRRTLASEQRGSDQTVSFLRGERNRLRKQVAAGRRDLAHARRNLEDLETSLQRALGVYREARDLYGELSESLCGLREHSRADLDAVAARLQRETDRRQSAERELEQATEGLHLALLRVEQSEDALKDLQLRSEEDQARLEGELVELRTQLAQAEVRIDQLSRALVDEKESSRGLSRRIHGLEEELFETERELDSSKGHIRFLAEQCARERAARRDETVRAGALERSLQTADEVERALQCYADRKEAELLRLREVVRGMRNGLRSVDGGAA